EVHFLLERLSQRGGVQEPVEARTRDVGGDGESAKDAIELAERDERLDRIPPVHLAPHLHGGFDYGREPLVCAGGEERAVQRTDARPDVDGGPAAFLFQERR